MLGGLAGAGGSYAYNTLTGGGGGPPKPPGDDADKKTLKDHAADVGRYVAHQTGQAVYGAGEGVSDEINAATGGRYYGGLDRIGQGLQYAYDNPGRVAMNELTWGHHWANRATGGGYDRGLETIGSGLAKAPSPLPDPAAVKARQDEMANLRTASPAEYARRADEQLRADLARQQARDSWYHYFFGK